MAILLCEGLLVVRSYANKYGCKADGDQMLFAYGAANIAAAFTGSLVTGNSPSRAAAAILDRQTFHRDVGATYEGIKPIDLVPNLSPQNMVSVEIGKEFMLKHGYIRNDFDVYTWAAPEFLEEAARQRLEEQWKKTTTSKLPETAAPLTSGTRLG